MRAMGGGSGVRVTGGMPIVVVVVETSWSSELKLLLLFGLRPYRTAEIRGLDKPGTGKSGER